jgi:hypothetical protein
MKKVIFKTLLIFSIIVIFNGCDDQKSTLDPNQITPMDTDTPTQTDEIKAKVGKEFVLAPGQKVIIDDANIELYFFDVNRDSRCPSDLDCGVAGTVGITLTVSVDSKTSDSEYLYINLGQKQEINLDYVLEFLKIEPERGKQFQEIPKEDYRATLKVTSTELPAPVIEVSDPEGVIFSRESLLFMGFKEGITHDPDFETTSFWDPSIDDVKKADDIVKRCLSDKEKILEDKFKDWKGNDPGKAKEIDLEILNKIEPVYKDYRRQYIGYIGEESNHKFVWINFFLPEVQFAERWKKNIINAPETEVRTSYHGYFDVLVDLEDDSCSRFRLGS